MCTIGHGLDNHNTVLTLCVIRWSRVVVRLIRIYFFSFRFISEFHKKHNKRVTQGFQGEVTFHEGKEEKKELDYLGKNQMINL